MVSRKGLAGSPGAYVSVEHPHGSGGVHSRSPPLLFFLLLCPPPPNLLTLLKLNLFLHFHLHISLFSPFLASAVSVKVVS